MSAGGNRAGRGLRVVSLNVNGLRSAARKGLFPWMARQRADVFCLQEVRARETQLTDPIYRPGYLHAYFHEAERPGYSGVAIYSRREPDRVILGMGWPEADREGRYLRADYGDLSVVSLYVPSGSAGPERQQRKFRFLDHFMTHLRALRREGRSYILCGDWNIAHRRIDLENWRGNQKNSGFLPEERAWMDAVLGPVGYVDAFRVVDPRPGQYTWWSNRGRAWEKNVGWRIDYQIVTPELGPAVRGARIYRQRRFSDHAPLIIDYDLAGRR